MIDLAELFIIFFLMSLLVILGHSRTVLYVKGLIVIFILAVVWGFAEYQHILRAGLNAN